MTIHDEYLCYQEKFEKKYGKDKTVVLMQIGSFHEAYGTKTRGPNLSEISELLNIILTKKDKKIETVDEKNPYMLGFPSVATQKYLKILISNGYTVIVIDQVTPPPNPKREITGIYSLGTYIDQSLSPDANNIVCLYIEDEKQHNGTTLMCIGMSCVDLSTGEITIHEAYSTIGDEKYSLDEALRFIISCRPKELIIYKEQSDSMSAKSIIQYLEIEDKNFKHYEKVDKNFKRISYVNTFLKKIYNDTGILSPLEYLNMERKPYATVSLVALLDFAYQHNENIINNLYKPTIFKNSKHLILGNNAINQLNVFETDSIECYNKRFKSLFDVVNNTSTAQGRRYLRSTLSSPIISTEELEDRYQSIDDLMDDEELFNTIEAGLKGVLDLERLNRKISLNIIHPYEFVGFYESLVNVKSILDVICKKGKLKKIVPDKRVIKSVDTFIQSFNETFIVDEMKKYNRLDIQNTVFNEGVYPEIDSIQNKIDSGITFMEKICEVLSGYITDVGRAKLKNKDSNDIKVYLKKNAVDGYYLNLTKLRAKSLKKNLEGVEEIKLSDKVSIQPSDLRFKELTKGNTKIFIDDLSKKSDDVVILRDKIVGMLFESFREKVEQFYNKHKVMFHKIFEFVAKVDFVKSAAKTAIIYNYCRPKTVNSESTSFIECTDIRHPIVERLCESEYIPHSLKLGKTSDNELDGMLIYGLNSSGKSTIMKAIGLSIIMAQSGMYVPAKDFVYAPYNNLFARITGNDNIFKGLSSFVLEMTELRAILKRTGPKTLVIGDEVCRGTEHISGNAIVAATVINLAKSGSNFIFATHLHEIASMDRIKALPNVKSFHLTVTHDKEKDCLVFDRKLKLGSGENIYGYTVARCIIDDPEFMKLVQEIKNEVVGKPNTVHVNRKSKYNSDIYINSCGICGLVAQEQDSIGLFDTHHINFQKDCESGFVKEKPHLQMNSKANLVVLCKKCHHNVHQGEILIKGYKETSKGLILDYDTVKGKDKRRRWTPQQVKIILGLKNRNISQMEATRVINKELGMKISTNTVRKIWCGKY